MSGRDHTSAMACEVVVLRGASRSDFGSGVPRNESLCKLGRSHSARIGTYAWSQGC